MEAIWCESNRECFALAVQHNKVDMLRELRRRNVPMAADNYLLRHCTPATLAWFRDELHFPLTSATFSMLVGYGPLESVQWLWWQGCDLGKCPLSAAANRAYKDKGRLEVMRWLLDHDIGTTPEEVNHAIGACTGFDIEHYNAPEVVWLLVEYGLVTLADAVEATHE